MNHTFRVSFESPQSGWMSLRLQAEPRQQLVLGVSHAPYDSLRDLIEGLTLFLSEGKGFVVRWNCEPEEYDFHVAKEGDEAARLRVKRYPNHRRRERDGLEVFVHRASPLEICMPFWMELRRLRRRSAEDVFESNWRREFPQREMRELTRAVRRRRREARAGSQQQTRQF